MIIRILSFLIISFVSFSCNCEPVPSESDRTFTPSTFSPEEVFMKTVKGSSTMKELTESLTYTDQNGIKWKAPAKTYTDGASVPRTLLPFTNGRFDNRILGAAVVHDAYCQEENKNRTPEQYRKRPWQDVHRMFFEALLSGGTPRTLALGMFGAVWLAGPRWDDPDNEMTNVSQEMLSAGIEGGAKLVMDKKIQTTKQMEDWLNARAPIIARMSQLEKEGLKALERHDLTSSEKVQDKADKFLQKSLNKLPNDSVILNLKGTFYKNFGEKYKNQDMIEKSKEKLEISEKAFDKVLKIDSNNPNALDGKNSIKTLRTDSHNLIYVPPAR